MLLVLDTAHHERLCKLPGLTFLIIHSDRGMTKAIEANAREQWATRISHGGHDCWLNYLAAGLG